MDPFDPATFDVDEFLGSYANELPEINWIDYLDPLPEGEEERPALEEEEGQGEEGEEAEELEEEERPLFTSVDDVRFQMGNVLQEINRMYGERGLAVVDEVLFDVRADRALEAAVEKIRGELVTMPVVVAAAGGGGLDEVAGSLLRWHGYCAAAPRGQKYLYWAQLLSLVEENVVNGMKGMCRVHRWFDFLAGRAASTSGLCAAYGAYNVPFSVVEGANDTVWQGWQETIAQDRHLAFMNTVEF
ncbi:uncharacterized protein EV154DRAFT_486175 [Mucor mucedo]|uniref:uncharacterized protein n=1 Tax=Mucor mucedo TaxID=29922 RepID=UPI00221EC8A5|nr:uncharacterized protein EV154DRAFT_486175 [Mucor mucedo]KAI7878541.1 hypothetical protein EV154DRAFT_486175 [Mucor mucedo]